MKRSIIIEFEERFNAIKKRVESLERRLEEEKLSGKQEVGE